jgi:formylglycine-generating enzyme required for sulfatase activity
MKSLKIRSPRCIGAIGTLPRVLRGGAYGTAADYLRSARRYGFEPAIRQLNFGVRPVRSLP